jgi:isopenicillin-N N-acyltransferase like protein
MIEFRSTGMGYERGFSHGKAFAPLVQEHIETTCRIEPGHEAQIADLLGCVEDGVRRLASSQLAELHGIADGAGVDFASILKLNFWPEVTIATVGLRLCSLVAFADVDGQVILGKTSDHPLTSLRFLAFQRVYSSAHHDYVRGTFLGTTGTRAGINAAGLAVCGAAIVADARNRNGVPVMITLQAILEQCTTVQEAVALAERMPSVNYGGHIMVGDAGGHAAVIELMPDRMAVRRPQDGVLFNTNHPLAPETRDHSAAEPALRENSYARLARLAALIAHTPRTVAGMQSILRDHTQPGAICQHGGPADLHTTGAYVLLPAQQTMLMAPGCPCQHEFIPLKVDS